MKQLLLAYPRGFCAGVIRALDTVELALRHYPDSLYILNEIVHNDFIVSKLRRRGVQFADSIEQIPEHATVIFSAHGVPAEAEKLAAIKKLHVIDATCPLVKRIHRKGQELVRRGFIVFIIGHRSHPEIIGTCGQLNGEAFVIENEHDIQLAARDIPIDAKVAYLTQTTLSSTETAGTVATLKQYFPNVTGSGDICSATTHRQNAVRKLASLADTVFVVGSHKSSNSNRLRETAAATGARAFLVNDISDILPDMLNTAERIGISAGASAPECLVHELSESLQSRGWPPPETIECECEDARFPLPNIS